MSIPSELGHLALPIIPLSEEKTVGSSDFRIRDLLIPSLYALPLRHIGSAFAFVTLIWKRLMKIEPESCMKLNSPELTTSFSYKLFPIVFRGDYPTSANFSLSLQSMHPPFVLCAA